MNLHTIKKVYLSGIGGIGLSALAFYFKEQGVEVIGSDLKQSPVTDLLEKEGITVLYEQERDNITSDCDMYIFSPAIPEDNPERIEASRLGIISLNYPQALALISKEYKTIGISGTNGKTTTTALLGTILKNTPLDPLTIVGSLVSQWGKNISYGKGNHFVVEACESAAHMNMLNTNGVVITNIFEDHLDYYTGIDHIVSAFQEYIDNVDPDGFVVTNFDDENTKKLIINHKNHLTFGFDVGADIYCNKREIKDGKQVFDVIYKGENLGDVTLGQPGDYNIYNALAAIAVALHLGVTFSDIKKSLLSFKGTWRRFEHVGTYNKAEIISDYGHHPEAIRHTLAGARELYPKKRIIIAFQPHHRNRTKGLFEEFISAFNGADYIILNEIYDVPGRENDGDSDISSHDLVLEIAKYTNNVEYTQNLESTYDSLRAIINKGDLVIIMGAGEIYKVAEKLTNN